MTVLKAVLLFMSTILLIGPNVECQDNYDFIIVGAGSAGSTLANRLTEEPSFNVLLLEAGEAPPKNSEIPLLLENYFYGTAINWNYTIEPDQASCTGKVDNRCLYSVGRTLGGSSQINNMLYVRGNKADYDLWEADGAEGWSFNDVLPYFKKAEGLTVVNDVIDESAHGQAGPLTVSNPSFKTLMVNAYIDAIKEKGIPNSDYNGKTQYGFAATQATIRDGYRCSTEKAYLQPAYNRSNLKIITGAFVTKVDLEGTKAVGVTYMKDNETIQVRATKEVILCAGAINTPQILMLSGIGPKQHLSDVGIDLVADLPVGQNLEDHIASSGLIFEIKADGVPTLNDLLNYTTQPTYDFPDELTGILSAPGLVEVIGLIKSPYEEVTDDDYNDIQYFILTNLFFQKSITPELMQYFVGLFDKQVLLAAPTVLHPKSRGNVTLRSTNPFDSPIIHMNYLTDPHDIKVMVYAMKNASDIVLNSTAFKQFEPKLIGPIPGCENFTLGSDDYFECISRLLAVSLYHASCTCKMGKVDDPATVVDSQLKVKGISSLRVVDTSIMPRVVSGNTNVPAIMIAEKAADLIKQQYADGSSTSTTTS